MIVMSETTTMFLIFIDTLFCKEWPNGLGYAAKRYAGVGVCLGKLDNQTLPGSRKKFTSRNTPDVQSSPLGEVYPRTTRRVSVPCERKDVQWTAEVCARGAGQRSYLSPSTTSG
jgi:hypothetical protein